MQFATCFFHNAKSARFSERNVSPCRNDLLEAGLDISKQNQHSISFSAETFSALEEEEVKAIYEYLNPTWKNITIIAYYRRYYDWILSFHNQVAIAENPWPTFERNSTDFLVRSITSAWSFFLKNIFSRIMCLLIQSALETSTVFGWNHFSEEDGGFNLVRRRDIFWNWLHNNAWRFLFSSNYFCLVLAQWNFTGLILLCISHK